MAAELSPRTTGTVAVAGLVVAASYASVTAWAATTTSYATWVALVLVPLLVLATVPMILRAGRRDPDPRFVHILMWAFAFKCLATVARYLMAFVLYDGSADAAVYDKEGTRLAVAYRDLDFGADVGRDFLGTGFMRVLTGAIYTVTGSSIFVAYAVFSWLGFWGLYFLYRAFRVALPHGDAHRYALLVLFLPSMLFWPSGLGKEAFVTFGIGLFAYGGARLLAGYRSWSGPLLSGMLLTGVVRPHVAAALFVSLTVAYLLRRPPRPATELTPLRMAFAVAVLGVGGWLTVSIAAEYLGVEEVSVASVDGAISDTAGKTGKGDSQYQAPGVGGITDLPLAGFSVLFRPLPFEATNAQMMLAAAEGSLLLVLVARSWRSLLLVPSRLRDQPYLILCLIYLLLFVYAFSNFSNFGLLTRERVQVLPFFLALLALPGRRATADRSAASRLHLEGVRR